MIISFQRIQQKYQYFSNQLLVKVYIVTDTYQNNGMTCQITETVTGHRRLAGHRDVLMTQDHASHAFNAEFFQFAS